MHPLFLFARCNRPLRVLALVLAIGLPTLAARNLRAQANSIPSADTASSSTGTAEQRGRKLLDEMVTALGGQRWLDRTTISVLGRNAAFFRGAPTGITVDFAEYMQVMTDTQPPSERIEYISDKSPILPGKRRDVAQVWTPTEGFEITYRGTEPLPKEQVADYMRRRHHSIEAVVHQWLKAPGVMVVSEGSSMVERHLAEKVSILSADNDAVTLELDANTHLPLARTFKWRNATFKDFDEDREEYDDYQPFGDLPTPLTLTRYRNGDMVSQRFLTKVEYAVPLPPNAFDPHILLPKKK